ncbi:hypothetical protein IW261DRAFT_1568104 [Armillaria novae-zelandiae]|uniref:Uncharacterized protein n=1 Tax=Armillaria novae-zelandiae TaxID=153914 RepID=A0AA39P0S8_9AGAR|nr:hypothetical protein IW261DRAFT_1568104 [Armillaria novae-zelandiae]
MDTAPGTMWADRLYPNKKYSGTTTKIQIPHRNVPNHVGASAGGSIFDAPLVDKDATPVNDVQRAPSECLLTPESPASTRQLRQNKRPSFVEQFSSLYNAGPGEDQDQWLTKLRNLYLGMTPERQEELVQKHSKESKWGDTWCGMVFLSIRKTPNRHLVKHEVRHVKIRYWDLVPTAAYTPCENCAVLGVVCEYGNRKTTRSCRECRLEGKPCQQLPLDDHDDDENEIVNDELETNIRTGEPKSPRTSLSGFKRGRPSNAQTTFLNIYDSDSPSSNLWFNDMFDAYTQMTRRQQEDIANACRKHDREKWMNILAGMVHLNIRAKEERPLIGTTVLNADISGWDVHPTYNEMHCKGCAADDVNCEFAIQNVDRPGCRECLILGRECVDFYRPQPAERTLRSRAETPAVQEHSIEETLTARLRSAKSHIDAVKATPSSQSQAAMKRNMVRIPPAASSSQQDAAPKHPGRISLRLPRSTPAENDTKDPKPKLKQKRMVIPLDPIPPSEDGSYDNDDEGSISMGPPTFNLPVTFTPNGLTFAPGALESLSRQATPAPSFALASAFRSPEPPSKRSRIDLDGRDVRYHTPMPVDEPPLYHKEEKLLERMEREVSRKDRELERKDQELEEMREKTRVEREGLSLLQGALEKDKEDRAQQREREREVMEMEREKERAAWRDASDAWKKERESFKRDVENWKLKVEEIRAERDKLKTEMDGMQTENDRDEGNLEDIVRTLQEMRARRKAVKEAKAAAVDDQGLDLLPGYMRLRIQTEPPLPQLKAWFPLPDDANIHDFKTSLCSTVQILRTAKIKPAELTLELDGFELLDELASSGVVRDTDLILIKGMQSASSKKRKAESESPVARDAKRLKPVVVSSDSDESADSESSTDSSSDDSSSSDSPSSTSSPSVVSVRKKSPPPLIKPQNHVPPGWGSQQTRSRNQRRRLKKKYEAEVASTTPLTAPRPKDISSTNGVPLGHKAPTENELSLSMFSLGNKNKKKGFKQKLAFPATPKIVFQAQTPRLVPPSEREDLPTNMLVTSVDVEKGKWGKKAKKEAIEEVALDYGEEDIVEDEDAIDEEANKMWETVEAVFDSYPVITQPEQSHVGNLVTWKALALNPITFSPEVSLHLARVGAVNADNAYIISRLVRPGWEIGDEPAVNETIAWGDVLSLGLKNAGQK